MILCVLGLAVMLGLYLNDYLEQSSDDDDDDDDDDGSGDDDEDDDSGDDEGSSSRNQPYLLRAMLGSSRNRTQYVFRAVLITVGCILTFAIIANFYTLIRILSAVCYPRKRRVVNLVGGKSRRGGGDGSKADAHLQPLRANVQLMSEMVGC